MPELELTEAAMKAGDVVLVDGYRIRCVKVGHRRTKIEVTDPSGRVLVARRDRRTGRLHLTPTRPAS